MLKWVSSQKKNNSLKTNFSRIALEFHFCLHVKRELLFRSTFFASCASLSFLALPLPSLVTAHKLTSSKFNGLHHVHTLRKYTCLSRLVLPGPQAVASRMPVSQSEPELNQYRRPHGPKTTGRVPLHWPKLFVFSSFFIFCGSILVCPPFHHCCCCCCHWLKA